MKWQMRFLVAIGIMLQPVQSQAGSLSENQKTMIGSLVALGAVMKYCKDKYVVDEDLINTIANSYGIDFSSREYNYEKTKSYNIVMKMISENGVSAFCTAAAIQYGGASGLVLPR